MLSDEEMREIIDAIASLNDKYDALSMEFLIYKATHEAKYHPKNGAIVEVTNWGIWARQIIVALITAITAAAGLTFFMGGA